MDAKVGVYQLTDATKQLTDAVKLSLCNELLDNLEKALAIYEQVRVILTHPVSKMHQKRMYGF